MGKKPYKIIIDQEQRKVIIDLHDLVKDDSEFRMVVFSFYDFLKKLLENWIPALESRRKDPDSWARFIAQIVDEVVDKHFEDIGG